MAPEVKDCGRLLAVKVERYREKEGERVVGRAIESGEQRVGRSKQEYEDSPGRRQRPRRKRTEMRRERK